MNRILLFTLSFLVLSCSSSNKKTNSNKSLSEIANGSHRSSENISRNKYRHPVETLNFFDVKPSMTVVELSPGGGWYSEILGPYLKDEGVLYLAIFDENSKRSYAPRLNEKIKKMASNKDHFGEVHFTVIDSPTVLGPVSPDGIADRVLTFRNIHSWMSDDKLDEVLSNVYKALKPGGIFGVVAHRSKLKGKANPKAPKGYANESYVKQKIQSAGFKFIASSEINANPKDSTDHPEGVWTLPPSLKLQEKNKAQYEAIGESDRMTLKFMKPKK